MMKLSWATTAWNEYLEWSDDKKTLKRINQLIKDIMRSPFDGIGKPEPLKGDLQGLWSRRINEKDRVVYEVSDEEILIVACRGHYEFK
jgi:toxin YoeB